MDKKRLRRQMRERRETLTEWQCREESRSIFTRLKQRACYQECEAVYCFASIRREVDTYPFMQEVLKEGKRLALPRVMGREIKFYYIHDLSELKEGFQGIPEPPETFPAGKERALLIAPGLVFDRNHYRAGYGGGYYDRYLSGDWKPFYTAGVCFDFQVVADLHPEPFDRKVDEVITPTVQF